MWIFVYFSNDCIVIAADHETRAESADSPERQQTEQLRLVWVGDTRDTEDSLALTSAILTRPLRSHVINMEKQLTALVQERRGQLEELFELK